MGCRKYPTRAAPTHRMWNVNRPYRYIVSAYVHITSTFTASRSNFYLVRLVRDRLRQVQRQISMAVGGCSLEIAIFGVSRLILTPAAD
jgi:hypothetical protein